jgi:hypothetical protein
MASLTKPFFVMTTASARNGRRRVRGHQFSQTWRLVISATHDQFAESGPVYASPIAIAEMVVDATSRPTHPADKRTLISPAMLAIKPADDDEVAQWLAGNEKPIDRLTAAEERAKAQEGRIAALEAMIAKAGLTLPTEVAAPSSPSAKAPPPPDAKPAKPAPAGGGK